VPVDEFLAGYLHKDHAGARPCGQYKYPPSLGVPMFDIPTVLTSQELIDKVLRRASRVTVDDRDAVYRIKKLSLARLESISSNIDATLVNLFLDLHRTTRHSRSKRSD